MLFLCLKRGDNLADGTIIIDTKIDNSGVKSDLKTTQKTMNRLKSVFGDFGNEISKAFSKGSNSADNYNSKLEKAQEAIKKEQLLISELQQKYDAIKNKDVVPSSLGKMDKEISKALKEFDILLQRQDEAKQKMNNLDFGVETSELKSARAEYQSIYDEVSKTGAKLDIMQEKAEKLRMNPEMSLEAIGLKNKIELASDKIARLKKESEQLGDTASRSFKKTKNSILSTEPAIKGMQRGFVRLKSIVAGALVFNVISSGLRNLQEYLWSVLKTNQQFVNSISQIKGNLMTAFNPIYEAVLPALNAMANALANVTRYIAAFISALFGKTILQSSKGAKALNNQVKAIKGVGSSAKKTAKEVKEASKSLASFDEINSISENRDSDSGNAGGGGGIGSGEIAPQFPAGESNEVYDNIKRQIDSITLIMSTAFLALGAILTFTGANIPLGIGLMLLGAAGMASLITENWGKMNANISERLTIIAALLSTSLLVLGAIFALSGANVPLGISLMIIGATGLATDAAISWGLLSNECITALTGIMSFVGGCFLALGAILCLSGANLPLGIALLLLGAVSLASAIGLNWNATTDNVSTTIMVITGIVGGALLALGAVLTFSGANLPLGIALMVLGAAVLATALVLNWSAVSEETKNTISIIAGIVGVALLVLGAVLTFSGANILLGIALLAAGAALLAPVLAQNWDAIKSSVQTVLSGIFSIVSAATLVLGIILCFSGVGIPLGLGLIFAGAKGIKKAEEWNSNKLTRKIKDFANGIIDIFERAVNFIIDKLNSISFTIPDWFPVGGGTTFGFNIKSVSIPRLAQGSVVPPNREFLALLGDNKKETEIVSPLSTMKQALAEVMNELGNTGGNTVVLELDGREVGRVFLPLIRKEERRKGLQLGGAY